MAERLYAIAAELRRADRRRARLRPLLRDRHDRPLARRRDAGEVWGVEHRPEAIADAEANAAATGSTNAQLPRRPTPASAIRPLVEEAGTPDLVVVDPPRAGLSKKIVRRVIECEAQRIVYVSCNPTTLAPNAAAARRGRL